MGCDMFEDLSKGVKNKLQRVDICSWEDIKSKTKKEVKALKGVGPKAFIEIEYHMSKDKVSFKAPEKKYKTNTDSRKKIILHFIKQKSKIRWPVEMRNADKLLSIYPLDFLLTINPKVNVYTLNYFFNEHIKKRLDGRYAKWKCKDLSIEAGNKEEVVLGIEKVGEDKKIDKPITLEDFLK